MVKKIVSVGMLLLALSLQITNAAKPAVFNDDKRNIHLVAPQTEFSLRVKSNPTTGYSWFLRDYNSALFTPIKHTREVATSGLIGAPGFEVFTFQVNPNAYVVPQASTISLVYMRPWQGLEGSSHLIFFVATH